MTEPDTISLLVRSAGRRPEPPSETAEAVYLSAMLAWRRAVRRRRLRLALAAAASLALVAVGVTWWAQMRDAGLVVAKVVSASGCSRIEAEFMFTVENVLDLPATCTLAMETSDRRTLRLAGPARAWFIDGRTLQLAQGRLYFDSRHAAPGTPAYSIETRYGRVIHDGTQFAIALSESDLMVTVRSGAVRITTPAMLVGVGRGEAVRIDASGREVARWPIETSGDAWAWADALAPALELEGRSLAEVLSEIARETGRLVAYENDDVRALCRTTRLHGPALALPADRMLDAVLAGTELDARMEGDRLLIARRAVR